MPNNRKLIAEYDLLIIAVKSDISGIIDLEFR